MGVDIQSDTGHLRAGQAWDLVFTVLAAPAAQRQGRFFDFRVKVGPAENEHSALLGLTPLAALAASAALGCAALVRRRRNAGVALPAGVRDRPHT